MLLATRPHNLADTVYDQLKSELFEFHLLPGDRFTEAEIASRTGASRTPVREALFRLEREGFLRVSSRSGWEVLPLDFKQLAALYEVRMLLEQASVRRMKTLTPQELNATLVPLEAIWQVHLSARSIDATEVSIWDEAFHCSLVTASKNTEFVRIHQEVTERLRIVRRLDFTQSSRITATYKDHCAILVSLRQREFETVAEQLATHIEASQAQTQQITLLRLQNARTGIES